jgi:hypothetical protein
VADVDDPAGGLAVGLRTPGARTHEQPGDRLDRALRRRQADADGALRAQCLEPLQREREVRAAFVAGDGVDLVHDQRPHAPQPLAATLGGHQEIQRLRGRDQEVRRPPDHGRALGWRRVAAAHEHADLRRGQPQLERHVADLGQRLLEVLLNVDAERLERRDVDDVGLLVEGPLRLELPVEAIDEDEEGRERLARARGCGDQCVAAGGDGRPALRLRLRRAERKTPFEPDADGGVKAGESAHDRSLNLAERV